MGRIAAPYGVKGWVKIQTFSQAPDALLDYPSWLIGKDGQWRDAGVEEASSHGEFVVAKLQDCTDRDTASALRGQEIAVHREALPETEKDEYYWEDLIGLTVFNREGIKLGQVIRLLDTGAHAVLVIVEDKEDAKEILIPFVGLYVPKVDLAQGIIEVDWGLDY
jgi:16S rRNA processing protein RimM